jgi:hypothetical protein
MLPRTILPLAGAAILSLAVAWADTTFADTARTGAIRVHEQYGTGRSVWFQGHWGFQYYMEQLGAKPVELNQFQPAVGDVVVMPTTNTNLFPMPAEWPIRQTFELSPAKWISTMNYPLGAGFYSDVFGPLPFVIGPVSPERFSVSEITAPNR